MHQSLQGATLHVEHIVPKSDRGPDTPDNLALACPSCNLGKSSRTHVPDLGTGQDVPLFHPRTDNWGEHFQWVEGRSVVGLTAVGRATIAALNLNHPRRRRIREAEESFGLFPPEG
jgi:hypothetical protein